jgi:uncharacterized protein involved in exopolysaccharide biosynthesis
MLFTYIGRVLWARRLVVLVATLASLAGGALMLLTTPKGYDAKNRVQLDLVKTDPITGFHLNSKYADAYIQAQMQQIQDFQVAAVAAERLGWLDNPDLQAQYASLPSGTAQDFTHWVAARVSQGTYVRSVDGTNLLEIRFRAVSPQVASLVAAEVRNAYVSNLSNSEAESARVALPKVQTLVAEAGARLTELQANKAAFEHQTGIVLLDGASLIDTDTRLLRNLARRVPTKLPKEQPDLPSSAAARLVALDDAIAEASRSMGPNNPQLIELRRKRDATAQQVQASRPTARDAAEIETASQRELAGQIESQRAKVLSQSERRVQLRLLQDEINRQQTRYDKAAENLAHLQQMSAGGGGNVTPIGITETSDKPSYPNDPLVLGGATALGLAAGILLAFLVEMSSRLVRVPGDLQLIEGRSVAVIPAVRFTPAQRTRRFPFWPARRGATA